MYSRYIGAIRRTSCAACGVVWPWRDSFSLLVLSERRKTKRQKERGQGCDLFPLLRLEENSWLGPRCGSPHSEPQLPSKAVPAAAKALQFHLVQFHPGKYFSECLKSNHAGIWISQTITMAFQCLRTGPFSLLPLTHCIKQLCKTGFIITQLWPKELSLSA